MPKKENSVNVGKYLFQKDIDFLIDINRLYASHTLIVGNTGSGKSNTVALLLQSLFEKNLNLNNSKFVVIDTNGEYSGAITKNKLVKRLDLQGKSNDLTILINHLNEEDWRILLEASEKTQYPLIRSVIRNVKKEVFDKINEEINPITKFINKQVQTIIKDILEAGITATTKLSVLLNINESLKNFDSFSGIERFNKYNEKLDKISVNNNRLIRRGGNDFQEITDELVNDLKTLTIDNEFNDFGIDEMGLLIEFEYLRRIYKYGLNENNLSPLIARFYSYRSRLKKIFKHISYNNNNTEIQSIEEILFGNQNLLILDVSNAGKDIRRIMVSFVIEKLYSGRFKEYNNKKSLHIIVDEAHNYLSRMNLAKDDVITESCIETFETIIKEGRKFGVFLTIATQRPSDITDTILSQCHNYIIHKLVNPKDISIMENSVPFLDSLSIKMLTILAPGQAIFSGTAFNKPNIVEVKRVDSLLPVRSSTIELTKLWI